VRNKVAEYIMEKLDSCVAIRYSIMQRMADEREEGEMVQTEENEEDEMGLLRQFVDTLTRE
jgi:hypothetical protein